MRTIRDYIQALAKGIHERCYGRSTGQGQLRARPAPVFVTVRNKHRRTP